MEVTLELKILDRKKAHLQKNFGGKILHALNLII
jgi:hypothetical protein